MITEVQVGSGFENQSFNIFGQRHGISTIKDFTIECEYDEIVKIKKQLMIRNRDCRDHFMIGKHAKIDWLSNTIIPFGMWHFYKIDFFSGIKTRYKIIYLDNDKIVWEINSFSFNLTNSVKINTKDGEKTFFVKTLPDENYFGYYYPREEK